MGTSPDMVDRNKNNQPQTASFRIKIIVAKQTTCYVFPVNLFSDMAWIVKHPLT